MGQDLEFLSCLYGSQREADELQSVANVSKLPIRQSTTRKRLGLANQISKLPIRQSTILRSIRREQLFSKLPIRQSTSPPDHG